MISEEKVKVNRGEGICGRNGDQSSYLPAAVTPQLCPGTQRAASPAQQDGLPFLLQSLRDPAPASGPEGQKGRVSPPWPARVQERPAELQTV